MVNAEPRASTIKDVGSCDSGKGHLSFLVPGECREQRAEQPPHRREPQRRESQERHRLVDSGATWCHTAAPRRSLAEHVNRRRKCHNLGVFEVWVQGTTVSRSLSGHCVVTQSWLSPRILGRINNRSAPTRIRCFFRTHAGQVQAAVKTVQTGQPPLAAAPHAGRNPATANPKMQRHAALFLIALCALLAPSVHAQSGGGAAPTRWIQRLSRGIAAREALAPRKRARMPGRPAAHLRSGLATHVPKRTTHHKRLRAARHTLQRVVYADAPRSSALQPPSSLHPPDPACPNSPRPSDRACPPAPLKMLPSLGTAAAASD